MPNIKLSPLTHLASLTLAVLIGVATFWVTTATAATGGTYYRADLANPPAQTRLVAHDIIWKCTDSSCVAGKGGSRPVIMCAALARKLGPVTNFVAGDKALGADELASCNGQK